MKYRHILSEAQSAEQFQRVSKTLLEHDAGQGVNYWARSPYPTMLLWAGRVYDFLSVLENILGYLPARRHSYLVGYRSGWDGAELTSGPQDGTPPEAARFRLLATGSEILAGAGWGRCSIDYDAEATTVRWEFPQGTAVGLAAKMEGPRKEPACAFMAGFIAGWTNRALGVTTEFLEVECVARGEPRCVFESSTSLRFRSGARPKS